MTAFTEKGDHDTETLSRFLTELDDGAFPLRVNTKIHSECDKTTRVCEAKSHQCGTSDFSPTCKLPGSYGHFQETVM